MTPHACYIPHISMEHAAVFWRRGERTKASRTTACYVLRSVGRRR